MPEGPEVWLIGSSLAQYLTGETLCAVEWTKYSEKFLANLPEQFSLVKEWPLYIKAVSVKGKLILIELNNNNHDYYILNRLGMSGQWSLKEGKWCHITLHLQNKKPLHYLDYRRFGDFLLTDQKGVVLQELERIKPSWIGCYPLLTEEQFIKGLRSRKGYLVSVLIAQDKVCSGIGNYILSEALYRAKIHPEATVAKVDDLTLRELFYAVKEVMEASVKLNGMSLRDYRLLDDEWGSYQKFLLVYGCTGVNPDGYQVVHCYGKHGSKRMIWYVPEVQVKGV